MPRRIQRQRTKGWRMPEGAVYVGRPSPWGNPFPIDNPWFAVMVGEYANAAGRRRAAVTCYRAWMTQEPIRLTADPDEAVIEYSDGRRRTVGQAIKGLAALMVDRIEVPGRPNLEPLRGRDLVCWCPESEPCHADVLLELANR